MSRKYPNHTSSWLDKLSGLWGQGRRQTAAEGRIGRHSARLLRFEPLENRALLSASIPAAIGGTVFYDAKADGVLSDGTRLSGVQVE
ncbi:MAG: hypothetical protein ABSG68_26640, partial [Thermoguttaceae bacterium]